MQRAKLGEALADDHPYVTIATQAREAAETTYPYTPSATEPPAANVIGEWFEYTPTGALVVGELDLLTA